MEVIAKQQVSIRRDSVQSNSFDCDPLAMDAILGLNAIADKNFRLDTPQTVVAPKIETQSSSIVSRTAVVFAPTEIVPASPLRDPWSLETEMEIKRARLLRLLDQQQSWYDAKQQAASAAEQFLSLCEHHQQQWLHPNQSLHQ